MQSDSSIKKKVRRYLPFGGQIADSINAFKSKLNRTADALEKARRFVLRTYFKRTVLFLYKKFPKNWRSDMAFLDTDIQNHGGKRFSQGDEDGIIKYIFSEIPPIKKFFVEFGVGPPGGFTMEERGLECNCRLLEGLGWTGLWMDGNLYPSSYQVKHERITAMNINELFRKYGVPYEFDLLSIDLDGQDFWIWSNLNYSPRVVIIEYNPNFDIDECKVMPFDQNYTWDGTTWYGASLCALHRLGQSKGYTLIYANGVNAFFVRDDLISNPYDFSLESVYKYRGRLDYHEPDKQGRAWITLD